MSSKSNDKQELPQTNSISQETVQELEEAPLESDEEEIPTDAVASSLGIRAQKKFLSKLSSKSVAKLFINETGGHILDNFHRLACNYSSKKDADKLRKSIIKSIVKMGILYKNDLFNDYELKLIDEFRNRFHSLAKSKLTSSEIDSKLDPSVLTQIFKECQDLISKIISTHLTQKSHSRINYVFNYISNLQFLQYLCDPNSTTNRVIIKEILNDIHSLIDAEFFNQK